MRYIDTGSRDPKHALGTWFADVVNDKAEVVALRIQTAFFAAKALGYFEPTLRQLSANGSLTRLLVGSNDGGTQRAEVANLLAVVGGPRAGLEVGIVSFQSGYFHPKVFHFERSDGSATAYVGSANLTSAGVQSQHVEAGIVVDTRHGDDRKVLDSISAAIDAWFNEVRGGFYPVATEADADALVAAGVIGVARPGRATRSMTDATGGSGSKQPGRSLYPLVAMPAIDAELPAARTPEADAPVPAPMSQSAGSGKRQEQAAGDSARQPVESERVAHWGKTMPASDAQRKASGNQSGAIALTQGEYRRQIDHTTYFRHELFGDLEWKKDTANTGQPKDVASVAMRVDVDGVDHGVLEFRLSDASNRESGQHNYTAQLHLEPISPLFRQADMTGKRLEIERFEDGTYALTIG